MQPTFRKSTMFSSSKKATAPPDAAAQDAMVADLQALLSKNPAPGGLSVEQQLLQSGEEGLTDTYLRRWLVARKWDVAQTEKDLRAHAVWRMELMPSGRIHEDEVRADLDQNKSFLNGYDAFGHPFAIVIAKRHIPHDVDITRKAICYALDASARLGAKRPNWDGKMTGIFDLSGMSYANYDLPTLRAVFDLLQNHYPERLDKLYLYRAPTMFYALWSLVSPFIDPVTKAKVVFIEKSEAALFKKVFDPKVFPEHLGGQGHLRPVEDVWRELLGETPLVNTVSPDIPLDAAAEEAADREARAAAEMAKLTVVETGKAAA